MENITQIVCLRFQWKAKQEQTCAFHHVLCLSQRRQGRGEVNPEPSRFCLHGSFHSLVSFSLPSSTLLPQKKTKQHSLFYVSVCRMQSLKQEEYPPERRLREPRDATASRASSLPQQDFLRHAYGRIFSVMLTYVENILRLR